MYTSDCVSFGLSIHFTFFLSVFTYPLLWPTCFLVSRSNPLSSQLLNQKQMFPILMKISQVKIPNWHHQMVCTGTSCEAAFSSSSGGEPNSTGDPLFLILSPCLKVRTFDWWESLMFVEDAGWETHVKQSPESNILCCWQMQIYIVYLLLGGGTYIT